MKQLYATANANLNKIIVIEQTNVLKRITDLCKHPSLARENKDITKYLFITF